MAIGIYFAPPAMSAKKYEAVVRALRQAGAGHPSGRSYHSSFGPKSKLMVFDVWSSRAAFNRFAKTLRPIMRELGVDPGKPTVMPVHKVIVPPARKASPRRSARKR